MTGRRPDSTTAFNFGRHFRLPDVGPDWTSMPGHFKNNGYLVHGQGKLYHPDLPPMYDSTLSWSSPDSDIFLNDDSWPGFQDGPLPTDCAETQPDDICGNIAWCAVNNATLEPMLGDNVNLAKALDRLKGPLSLSAGGGSQPPFFMAVGLHKVKLNLSASAAAASLSD